MCLTSSLWLGYESLNGEFKIHCIFSIFCKPPDCLKLGLSIQPGYVQLIKTAHLAKANKFGSEIRGLYKP